MTIKIDTRFPNKCFKGHHQELGGLRGWDGTASRGRDRSMDIVLEHGGLGRVKGKMDELPPMFLDPLLILLWMEGSVCHATNGLPEEMEISTICDVPTNAQTTVFIFYSKCASKCLCKLKILTYCKLSFNNQECGCVAMSFVGLGTGV